MGNYEKYLEKVSWWLVEVKRYLENYNDVKQDQIRERIILLDEKIQSAIRRGEYIPEFIQETQIIVDSIAASIQSTMPIRKTSVPIGEHKLPPLTYPYKSLEPYISEQIMILHHDRHHKSYVDGLNKAEIMMQKARKENDYALIKHWEREAAFHGSGHNLHTIFWEIMNPKGGGKPKGELLEQIVKDFGSYEAFKAHFSAAAKAVEGIGWALLVWSPRSRRLEILQSERHMLLTQWDTIPILVLDVWEHAYYLQYLNNREEYVDHWWNIVYWPAVESRYKEAKKLTWEPY
ncbi:superoxide dismutase [Peribacillus tepidiphilus]|uniref:superoxide dismutase n=1 Tax=Peribacillus tepidiphilus TaxID=2652445 RepID=UPI0035B52A3B